MAPSRRRAHAMARIQPSYEEEEEEEEQMPELQAPHEQPTTRTSRYFKSNADAPASSSSSSSSSHSSSLSSSSSSVPDPLSSSSSSSSSSNSLFLTSIKQEVKEEEKEAEEKEAAEEEEKKEASSNPFEAEYGVLPSLSSISSLPGPAHWQQAWAAIVEMRLSRDAPVDSQGCESGVKESSGDEKKQRFRILVSLMLSSQTKDEVTFAATENLHRSLEGGLTVESVNKAEEAAIDALIGKVGFHRRKANFIKRTAHILLNHFDGDIPNSIEGLCSLPGVGPKMAFLAMNSAWKQTVGIGVDIHVHRIANRLGWVKTREAEDTRVDLESFLPRSLWRSINVLLVGFGQTVCLPRNPQCQKCKAAPFCPVGKVNVKRIERGLPVLTPTKDQARESVKAQKRKRTTYAKFDESSPSSRLKSEAEAAGVSMKEEREAEDAELRAESLEQDSSASVKSEAVNVKIESSSSLSSSSSSSSSSSAMLDESGAPSSSRRSTRARKMSFKE